MRSLFRLPSLIFKSTALCAALAGLLAGEARAATFGWSGSGTGPGSGTGTAWLTAGNWTNNLGTPTNIDIAFFGAGGSGTTIGFNFNVATITTTNIGAIVLGAGSTVNRAIGNSSTTAGIATFLYFNGISGGLLTNSVAARTLTLQPFASGTGPGMTNMLLTSGVIEAVGPIFINNSIAEAGGARTITKTGGGVLSLGAQNTFSGKMIINAGTLAIADENRLGNNPGTASADTLTLNDGTLLAAGNVVIDDANRGITLGASHGTFAPSNTISLTLSRPIAGPGNLTNNGTGTLILNAVNTYSGRTTLRAGVTRALADSAFGALPGSYVADQLIIDNNSLLLNQDSEFNIQANRGVTIGAGGARFSAGFARPWGVNSIIAGPGVLTIANDSTPHIVFLNGANTFTNDLIVNNTTAGNNAFVAINGSIGAGSVVRVTTNGWLLGTGVINRSVIATNGAVINGGLPFLPGTLTVNGTVSLTNAVLSPDLAAVTTVGAGVNDLLQVNGNLVLSGSVIVRPNALAGTLATGTYRLINYTGTLTGSAANLVADVPGYTITFDTSFAGQVNMTVSGAASTVTWTGFNGPLLSPQWDVAFTTNFTDGVNPTVFRQGQNVILDNNGTYFSGGLVTPVNMVGPSSTYGALYPATVTVATTNNVTLTSPSGAAGKISGAATVFKSGSGILAINTGNANFPNDYTGPTIISGGIVRPGYARAFGATNGPTISTNGGTMDVNGQANLGAEPFIISGPGVSNNGAIINSGTGQQNALRYLTLSGNAVIGGVNRWDVRNYAQNNNWPNAFVNGGGFSLIKTGANQVSFVDVGDVNLGKMNIRQGIFQLEGNSMITNNSFDVELDAGATFGLWGSTRFHTKPVAMSNNSRIFKDNGTTTNDGPVALTGGTALMEVANNSGDILEFRNILSGPGGFAKIGAGHLVLSGTNTYAGATVISNGTLTLNTNASIANSTLIDVKSGAILNLSNMVNPLTISSGKTLAGAGSIRGRVIADTGANVIPGSSPGTLSVSSNLTFNSANLFFELNTATNEGAAINDSVNARDLTLSGVSALNIIPLTPLTLAPYTIMRYTNTLTGGAPNLTVGGGSRYTWTVDTSVANLIRITPAGAPASLTWAGGVLGSETLWNVNTTANWTNAAVADKFFQGDAVSFTDFSTYTNITLVGSLSPGNLTANHTFPITFGGAGQIKTLNQVAKSGTGTLILANENPELNGGITINAGVLQIGAGGTSGSVGPSAPITNNATLVFNRSDSNGLANVIRGTGGFVKNGAGTLALAGANQFTGPVTVNGGTLRTANAGAFGSASGIIVNSGGQVDLAGVSPTVRSNNYFLAGNGPDGRGALLNSGVTVAGNSGITNLTLNADASIGLFGTDATSFGRVDIGSGVNPLTSLLNANNFALTKLGPGQLNIRVVATNFPTLIVSNGLVYGENVDFNLATNITVHAGGQIGMFGTYRTNASSLALNAGATVVNVGGSGTNVWTGPVTNFGASTINVTGPSGNGSVQFLNNIYGSAPFTAIGGNSRFVELYANNDATYSGGWVVASGTILRSVDGGTFGPGAITNFGTLDFVKTNSGSLLAGVYGNGLLRHFTGPGSGGAVTLGGVLQMANLQAQGGGSNTAAPLTFNSTALARINNTLSAGHTNTGGRMIFDGATIQAANLFLGENSSQTGIVSHVNATVIVTNQVRLGHWPNAVNTYTMDGGSFTVTVNPAVNPSGTAEQNGGFYVGVDGVALFTQNSGDVTAAGLVIDNRTSTTLPPNTNTYTLNGGTLTLGRWGIQSPNTTYQINLGAGTLGASANWTSVLGMSLTAISGVTINPGTNTITLNGPLSGGGGLQKAGAGTLLLNGFNTFTTDVNVYNGTLGGTGSVASYLFIDTLGTFAPGQSGPGLFTISNNSFGLAGTMIMEISRSGSALTNDRLRVFTGDIGLAGPLVVTNISGPLFGGEVFDLLDWDTSITGTFTSITLPALAPNLSWDTTQLYVDGTIRVLGPPTIILGPSNITAYVGDNVSFSVLADGVAPVTNQWSKDGVNLPGANSNNLAFTNLTLANAGTYTFCTSNLYGGTCASATLTVLNVTNIADGLIAWWKLDEFDTVNNRTLDSTTNLQHLAGFGIQASNVITGVRSNAFNFNGAATNFVARINSATDALPAYKYPATTVAMWVKGNYVGQNDRRVFAEGSTNNTTPIFGFGTHNTGGGPQVDLFIRPTVGVTVNHNYGRLTAFDGNWHHITLVDNNGSLFLYVDGQFDTNISYVRGSMPVNTAALANLLRATTAAGFIGSLDDTMIWRRALGSNEAAQVFTNALQGPPVITVQPVAQTVPCSGNATFNVAATSLDSIRYQWFFGASPIADATNSSLLRTASTATAGQYSVVLSNLAGAVTSSVVTLTVTNTPSLISPAGPLAVGTENNDCGTMVLAGGSAYRWELNNATGGAGLGWDLLNVTGDLNIEATSGNPFLVNLWSLNGAVPGLAANWNNDTTNVFTIATPSGAVNGFAANKFTLNTANFSNDLAGGTFAIEEGSLKLKFTPNHAPIATSITNNRPPNLTWKIKIADVLATLTSDVDGDARGLTVVGASTNGVIVTTNATHIFYTNPNNVEDEFTYTVRDYGPTYRAGDTVRTATGTLRLTVSAPAGTNQNAVAISFTNGVVGMRFAGIPGYNYDVQRATNLTPPVAWTTLHNTNCPPLGLFDYIDLTPPAGQAYYRTAQP